jgi:hypothetical protein
MRTREHAHIEEIEASGLDDDLKARLHQQAERGFLSSASWTLARMEQEKRDKRADLTAVERRRFDYANDAPQAIADDLRWIHSVTALCGMPYKALPPDRDIWVKKNGKAQLWIRRGYLPDPMTGDPVMQAVPYGPKARLLFFYLCNEAVRNNCPEIQISETLTGFIRDLGFEARGGGRGTIKPFRQQLDNILACEMAISYADGEGYSEATFRRPVEKYQLWIPRDDRQQTLWRSTVTLSPQFFESLARHRLPIDIRALRAVSQSSRQMDLIVWLTYRSRSIERPTVIGWEQLQGQFSQTRGSLRSFKQQFRDDIKALQELIGNRLRLVMHETKGLIIYPMESEGSHPSLATRGLVPSKALAKTNAQRRRDRAARK